MNEIKELTKKQLANKKASEIKKTIQTTEKSRLQALRLKHNDQRQEAKRLIKTLGGARDFYLKTGFFKPETNWIKFLKATNNAKVYQYFVRNCKPFVYQYKDKKTGKKTGLVSYSYSVNTIESFMMELEKSGWKQAMEQNNIY